MHPHDIVSQINKHSKQMPEYSQPLQSLWNGQAIASPSVSYFWPQGKYFCQAPCELGPMNPRMANFLNLWYIPIVSSIRYAVCDWSHMKKVCDQGVSHSSILGRCFKCSTYIFPRCRNDGPGFGSACYKLGPLIHSCRLRGMDQRSSYLRSCGASGKNWVQ